MSPLGGGGLSCVVVPTTSCCSPPHPRQLWLCAYLHGLGSDGALSTKPARPVGVGGCERPSVRRVCSQTWPPLSVPLTIRDSGQLCISCSVPTSLGQESRLGVTFLSTSLGFLRARLG